MKVDKNTIKNLQRVKIKCIPAVIRKCNGCVVETMTVQPNRAILFQFLNDCRNIGLNVYGLRHPESDWSYPISIKNGDILVNRIGWFITPDKMKFPKNNNEIYLSSRNAKYVSDDEELVESYYDGYEILLSDYLIHMGN